MTRFHSVLAALFSVPSLASAATVLPVGDVSRQGHFVVRNDAATDDRDEVKVEPGEYSLQFNWGEGEQEHASTSLQVVGIPEGLCGNTVLAMRAADAPGPGDWSGFSPRRHSMLLNVGGAPIYFEFTNLAPAGTSGTEFKSSLKVVETGGGVEKSGTAYMVRKGPVTGLVIRQAMAHFNLVPYPAVWPDGVPRTLLRDAAYPSTRVFYVALENNRDDLFLCYSAGNMTAFSSRNSPYFAIRGVAVPALGSGVMVLSGPHPWQWISADHMWVRDAVTPVSVDVMFGGR